MKPYFNYDLFFLPLPFHQRFLKPLGYLVNSIRTLGIFLREKPDTVWVQLAPTFLLYIAFLYKLTNKSVNVVADCHNSMFNPLWLNLPLARYLLERCQIVLVHNDHVKQHAEEIGVAPGRLAKLETRPAQVQCDSSGQDSIYSRPWVLFPCSFDSDEPIEAVLRAAEQIPDVTIAVTGNTRRAVGRHDLSNIPRNVTLVGFLPKERFNELLCNADLILGLTTSDNVQLSVANEAVGAQKPMVISDTKLLRSLFYKGAVYVETTSAESIAHGLKAGLENHAVLIDEVQQLRTEREARWCTQAEYVRACVYGTDEAIQQIQAPD